MNESDNQSNTYGDIFQQNSKYVRGHLPRHRLNWMNKPATYKIYKNPLERIKLPELEFPEDVNFWKTLIRRRSTRSFTEDPITFEQVGLLLFGISGITRKSSRMEFRTTPSAGGLYPIEIYLAINNVIDLKQGIYHYNVSDHESLSRMGMNSYHSHLLSLTLMGTGRRFRRGNTPFSLLQR